MFRTKIYASAICFSTICSFASIGFTQEFCQPRVAYTRQYSPDRNPASNVGRSQITYNSAGARTKTYGGLTVIQEGAVRDDVAQNRIVQERVAQERIAQERIAQERIAQERIAQERIAQEHIAQEHIAQEHIAQNHVAHRRVAQNHIAQNRVFPNRVFQEGAYQGGVVYGQPAMEHVFLPDYGYNGPGDMRTHLWKDHSDELKTNGVSRDQLDSMSMEMVQKWHNFFHGTEDRPHH